MGVTRAQGVGAVGDAIVHGLQIRQVKQVLHQRTTIGRQLALDGVVLCQGKVDRNGLRAGADLELDAMVLL